MHDGISTPTRLQAIIVKKVASQPQQWSVSKSKTITTSSLVMQISAIASASQRWMRATHKSPLLSIILRPQLHSRALLRHVGISKSLCQQRHFLLLKRRPLPPERDVRRLLARDLTRFTFALFTWQRSTATSLIQSGPHSHCIVSVAVLCGSDQFEGSLCSSFSPWRNSREEQPINTLAKQFYPQHVPSWVCVCLSLCWFDVAILMHSWAEERTQTDGCSEC